MTAELTISSILTDAIKNLKISNTPRLDAEILLCHVLKKDRSYLFIEPKMTVKPSNFYTFQDLILQRKKNIPISYLIGYKNFWSFQLTVNQHVLIPRPETEHLVTSALQCLVPNNAIVVDLGTGSGAIALALAHEKPNWQIFAVEKYSNAIKVAKKNAKNNNITSINFLKGDWLTPLKNIQPHMIVSNPPYIKKNDLHLLKGDVQFEPTTALISGNDGLKDIRIIISQSRKILLPGGYLLIEHGYDQKKIVQHLFHQSDFYNIESHQDLAGKDRITMGQTQPTT